MTHLTLAQRVGESSEGARCKVQVKCGEDLCFLCSFFGGSGIWDLGSIPDPPFFGGSIDHRFSSASQPKAKVFYCARFLPAENPF